MKLRLPGKPSLVRRLILLAAGWSLTALAVTGFLLSAQFERASLSRLDSDLTGLAEGLVSGVEVTNGQIKVPPMSDERFSRTFSGHYWQIAEIGPQGQFIPRARSPSLFDTRLATPDFGLSGLLATPGRSVPYDALGPVRQSGVGRQPLRAGALYVRSLDGHPAPLVFMVAEDRTSVDRDIRTFATTTAVALILLGLFIVAGVWVQVRWGLQPIFDLSREVAEVRKGRADRLADNYPAELAPLAEELNALVAHNHEVVERQRTHVGNLAHALKTPISVMLTEAGSRPGPLAEVVRRQSQAMHSHVEHHLQRARAAARAQGNREVTPVAPVLEELSRTLERIFREREIAIDWSCPPDIGFRGERQDLLEIIGNVLENACKWSAGKVTVTVAPMTAEAFAAVIEDNGPGLPADRRDEVLKRGARLDEATPGTGLGLSIVDELARAYGGAIALGDSALGGLRVQLTLPRPEV